MGISRHSDRFADLAPLAAIGVLDGPDREDFRAHLLTGCRRCDRAVRDWQRVLADLAWTVPERPPGSASPRRLRDAAVGEPSRRIGAPATRPWGWLAVAATLLFAVAGLDDAARRRDLARAARSRESLEAENRRNRDDLAGQALRVRFLEDPDVQAILLTGQGPQPGARGKVVFSPRARRAIFVAAALAPVPGDRQYELWFLAGGKAIAAGTFDPAREKATVFESSIAPAELGAVEKFAVTIEPRGGVAQPTGPIVLAGDIPQPS